MAITRVTTNENATEKCPTCGHVPDPEKRLRQLAYCLEGHEVHIGFSVYSLDHYLGHSWHDEHTYSAVKRERPFTEGEILAWLERCHTNQTERRPREEGLQAIYDTWEAPPDDR